jgi:iron complex outermembrane recepter protein
MDYPLISILLRRRACTSGLLLALLLIFCIGGQGSHLVGAGTDHRTFAVMADDAEKTLEKFSEQAGVQIVYLLGDVRGVTTNPVQGTYAIREALDRLVAHTTLKVEVEGKTGAFVIKRERTPLPTKTSQAATYPTNPPMKKSLPARLTAALVALASSVLVAQDAQNPTAPGKDEAIVLTPFTVSAVQDKGYRASNSVSGSRIDTPIKDLPFALQAFTAEFISDINPHDLFDVVRYSPGVTNRNGDFAAGNAGNFAIRGFATGSNPLRNGFAGPPIVDSVNIARVEIVKGPASFLYGQLAPGGLVNIITKRPQSYRQTSLRQEVGTDNYLRTQLDTTGPIANTKVFYRLGGSWQNDFEYYQPYEAQQWDLAPSALWQITPNASLSVDYEHFQKSEIPLMMIPNIAFPTPVGYPYSQYLDRAYPVPKDWNSADYSDFRDSNFDNLVINAEAKIGEHWNARAAYAYIFRKVDFFTHGNFSLGNTATTNAGNIPATATLPIILQQNAMGRRPRELQDDGYQHTFTAETTGIYQFGGVSARLLLGYQKDKVRSNSATWQAPVNTWPRPWDLSNPATWDRHAPARTRFSADLPLTGSSQADIDIEAYWAGVTLGFMQDRLTLLAGSRHTETVNKSFNKITGAKNPIFEREKNTPQVGLLYKLTDEISAFASMSQSFVPNNSLLRVLGVPTTPAEPTVGKGWDVGVKAALANGKLSGTLSVYDVRNTNIIQNVVGFAANGDTVFSDFQSGEQESKGVELDLVYTPTNFLQIYAAYSHQNPIYTSNPAFPILEGKPLEGSTKNLASLWAKYRLSQESLKGVYVAGGFTWQDKQQVRLENPDLFYASYALFDLQVGYETKWRGHPCTIELAGKNLGDKNYLPSNNSRGLQRRFILSFSTKL